jgi:hypothetical protein
MFDSSDCPVSVNMPSFEGAKYPLRFVSAFFPDTRPHVGYARPAKT